MIDGGRGRHHDLTADTAAQILTEPSGSDQTFLPCSTRYSVPASNNWFTGPNREKLRLKYAEYHSNHAYHAFSRAHPAGLYMQEIRSLQAGVASDARISTGLAICQVASGA